MKNPINYIAFPLVMIGIAGIAGSIECGKSPAVALILLAAGCLIYQSEESGRAVRRTRTNFVKKILAVLLAVLLVFYSIPVHAAPAAGVHDESTVPDEPFKICTTAYCYGEITASGAPVREGICAVKKEWMGNTALVWKCGSDGSMGDFLGFWECLDTGFGGDSDGNGIGSIQEGKVIDMYFPTLEGCGEWMELTGGRVYVQLIYAEG